MRRRAPHRRRRRPKTPWRKTDPRATRRPKTPWRKADPRAKRRPKKPWRKADPPAKRRLNRRRRPNLRKERRGSPERKRGMENRSDVTRSTDVAVSAFASSLEHLLAELERIDLLIAAEIARARRLHAGDEQFRGLYISEAEVDLLLRQPVGQPRWAGTGMAVLEHGGAALDQIRLLNRRRSAQSVKDGIELRLECLERCFGLSRRRARSAPCP